MIDKATFDEILRRANAAVDKRYDEREIYRTLMPDFPGFTWVQIKRGLTVPACGEGKTR